MTYSNRATGQVTASVGKQFWEIICRDDLWRKPRSWRSVASLTAARLAWSSREADIQGDLDRRRPGPQKHTTQRNEPDQVQILSGVFEGKTTGTPIGLIIENTDQRSKDYGDIKDKFRPGHADYTYQQKYGIRDYRGGGRSSARETAMRVAAGAIARKYLQRTAGHRNTRLSVATGSARTGGAGLSIVNENRFSVLTFAHSTNSTSS